jgi:ubiquinone/menaquinone biosynthesis C-methylase UbiE
VALRLLPRDQLVKTGDVDHADWNYGGLLGFVSRARFRLVVDLLSERSVDTLLEVGYGSGVFLPELARHARHVFGADIHPHAVEVTQVLDRAGVYATLVEAPAEQLPFAAGTFDAVVAVSTFEFVSDAGVAIDEIARVLRPGGCAIVVTPGASPLLDLALRIATGEDAKRDFGGRREAVVSTLTAHMKLDRMACFPFSAGVTVYRALRLVKR